MTLSHCLAAGLFVILFLPGVAIAEPSADKAKAKALIKSGDINYRLSKFDLALADYEAAYKLTAHPGIIFNIAQAHRQLKNHEKARFHYKLFLSDWRRRFPDKPPPYEGEVTAHIRRLTELVDNAAPTSKPGQQEPKARLKLEGLTSGAQVLVDGSKRDGPTLDLRPGRRSVKVELDGFHPWERALDLAAGALHTEHVALEVVDHRNVWLIASISSSAVAAAFLVMGVAYNVHHDNYISGTPEADENKRLSQIGYGIAGGVAALAVASWTYYLLHRRRVLRLRSGQRPAKSYSHNSHRSSR